MRCWLVPLTLMAVAAPAQATPAECQQQLCWQVAPTVCVSNQRSEHCALTFNLRWSSSAPLSVCAELSDEQLQCWHQQQSGELTHQIVLAGPQQLALLVDGKTRLVEQLSVLSRQPDRRKRLVAPWSVF